MRFAPKDVVSARMVKSRDESGKTQQDIAAETKRSQPAVSSWESAEKLPEQDQWEAVAKAYGFESMEALFFVDDEQATG